MPVLTGLDVLVQRQRKLLRGRKIGLLAHQASVDRNLTHAAELLADLRGARLVRLFAPEHGLWGSAQDHAHIRSTRDPVTGLRVVSLYGERREPTGAMLAGLDTLVIDLQDIGSRYYTFQWTTALAMRACARAGVRVIVLDRPNPLGGVVVEGNVPDPAFRSFVGLYPLPARHGLTLGETATYLNRRHGLGADLTVVPMTGWRRRMLWEDTGVPWVAPSPNMPTTLSALVYPGGCLVEATELSEGRGTTRPFQLMGAPFIDPKNLADELNGRGLPGVRFIPTWFRPQFQKHRGQVCGGVELLVTDGAGLPSYRVGVEMLDAVHRLWPEEFAWREAPYEFVADRPAIDLLTGGPECRQAIESGEGLEDWIASWKAEEEAFLEERREVLLYPEDGA